MTASDALARLRRAEWLSSGGTRTLFDLLDGDKGATRVVGGAVRDALMGRPTTGNDIDFATILLPDEVVRRAQRAGLQPIPTGIDHGTVTIRAGDYAAEVTTLREDIETMERRAIVRFGTNWTRDAERRDFTMNALYSGPDGELFDPLGSLSDCLNGVVRFIGDPVRRIDEDRLRVFRFFRFTASHGRENFDTDGLAAVRQYAGDLAAVSAERIGNEMRRILKLPRVAKTLREMAKLGLVSFGEGELSALARYENHTSNASLGGRLALLFAGGHQDDLRRSWRLSNDETYTAERILAASRLLIDYQLAHVAYHFPAVLGDAVDVAAALANWSDAGRAAIDQRIKSTSVAPLPVRGADLVAAGVAPGPAVGRELDYLETLWVEHDFSLTKAELLSAVRARLQR